MDYVLVIYPTEKGVGPTIKTPRHELTMLLFTPKSPKRMTISWHMIDFHIDDTFTAHTH